MTNHAAGSAARREDWDERAEAERRRLSRFDDVKLFQCTEELLDDGSIEIDEGARVRAAIELRSLFMMFRGAHKRKRHWW